MNRTFLLSSLSLAALVGIFLAALAAAQEEGIGMDKAHANGGLQAVSGAGLRRMSAAEREALLSSLVLSRRADEEHLIAEFEAATDDNVRAALAYIMGAYRMSGAVKPLAKHIALDLGFGKQTKEALIPQYPVLWALVKIGKPAESEMLEIVATTDDAKARQLAIRVVRHIEGPELSTVVLDLQIKAETDPKRKERLQEGLNELRALLQGTGT